MDGRTKKESSERSHFVRGEKGTSSVRLRKRRDDVNQLGRRQNRHSGDFVFSFSTKETGDNTHALRDKKLPVNEGDQWNYVTFPNGVPNVQEVKIDTDIKSQEEKLSPANVKLMIKEMPWMTPVKRFSNLGTSGPLSGSVLNVREPIQQSSEGFEYLHVSHAESNDVNGLDSNNKQRFGQHARSKSQQPTGSSNYLKQSTGFVNTSVHGTPTHSKASYDVWKKQGSCSAKKCSSEFEYKKAVEHSELVSLPAQTCPHEMDKAEERQIIERMIKQELNGDTISQESEESGIFSTSSSNDSPQRSKEHRKPGLGRRALTQINIRDRKSSYSSNLAKSQENLVKVPSNDRHENLVDENGQSLCIKKGFLWQQRDKLFSRWKERYFILTKGLLQCFKKDARDMTDASGFIFEIKISEIEDFELLDKRGFLTICINVQRQGKVFLRKTEGIRDWFESLKKILHENKSRKSNRASAIFVERRQKTDSSGMEKWIYRKSLGNFKNSESTPEINKSGSNKERISLDELSHLYKNEELEEERRRQDEEDSRCKAAKKVNRLSLMSDIDYTWSKDYNDGEIFPGKSIREIDSSSNSTSTGSSKMSGGQCLETSFMEEDEDIYSENISKISSKDKRTYKPQINKTVIEVKYEERTSKDVKTNKVSVSNGHSSPRHHHRQRSANVNNLQTNFV